jgi:hypothetical protein
VGQADGIVAVFDFDYGAVIDFDWQVKLCAYMMCPPVTLILPSLCCEPCFAKQNIEWNTKAMHVAVHQDGIKFVNDKHPTGCGLSCTDQGKSSKTVPFDKLTDCDVQEPAGTAVCCFIDNVLSTVTVDTASSGQPVGPGQSNHELELRGLKDPHGFKKCVWDCKRGAVNLRDTSAPVAAAAMAMDRGGGGAELAPILLEIRDELRAQTQLLQKSQEKSESP